MTTFSISLPSKIASQVDSETQKQGFATRSEFMRTLLRRYFIKELPSETFTPKPISEIRLELAQTGKYSQEFIESVIKGLSQSSIYAG